MTAFEMKTSVVTRGVAELLVIVVGVLIALGLDNWNQDRKDRELSYEYVERLVGDLRADVAWADQALEGLEDKREALSFLLELGADRDPEFADASRLVRAFPGTLMLAFNAPSMRTATIDDMRSTGSLSLISEVELREEILRHYALATNSESRLEGRMTDYPGRAFERVPTKILAWRDIIPVAADGEQTRDDADPPVLTETEFDALLAWLRETEAQRLVNAERNYSVHAIRILVNDRARALRLIGLLESRRLD